MRRKPESRVGRTLDVFNQNLAGTRAGVRLANGVDGNNPEAVALQRSEAGHRELRGGVEGVGVIDPDPVRLALILDLDDVALDGASSVPLRGLPGQRDAVLRLVCNLRSRGHARRSWSEEQKRQSFHNMP